MLDDRGREGNTEGPSRPAPGAQARSPIERARVRFPRMALLRGDMAALLAAAARTPSGAGEEVRRLLDDPSYQRALPKTSPDLPQLDLPWLGRLLEILAYTGAAVLAALLLAFVLNRLLARRARDAAVEAQDEAAAPALHVDLDEPGRLAAAGRFAEAIHQLLLETLAALSRASRLPPSYTSREILAGARLPARAREALSGLVLAVELSRFGGAPAGEEDYRACVRRFDEFLESYRGPAEPAPEVAA